MTLILIAFFASCSQENRQNEAIQNAKTRTAENSTEKISELPLGFNFGMTQEEVMENINQLLQEGIVKKIGNDYYEYVYELSSGEKFETDIKFRYYEGELYALSFSFPYSVEGNDKFAFDVDNDLTEKLDTTYSRVSYYEKGDYFKDGKSKMIFTKWFKGNQYIFLRHALGSDLTYLNAPIDKIISDKRRKETIQRAMDNMNNVEVKNSSWDGSVSQVKSYLKSNLKDPKSYEGIEWSKVSKTSDGYMVRHKYRAKNSFGGYVVENQVFYLNNKGNVTKVVNY